MKKKLLIVNYGIPYPTYYGGDARILEIIQYLSNKYEISYACMNDKKKMLNVQYMYKYCKNVYSEPINVDLNILKKFILLLNIIGIKQLCKRILLIIKGVPFSIARLYHIRFCNKLLAILKSNTFDIIQFENMMMGQYIDCIMHNIGKAKTVLVEHAIGGLEYKRAYQNSKGFKKIYNYYEYKNRNKYEKIMLRKFNNIIVLSENEKKELIKLGCNTNKISIIPTGINVINNNKYSCNKSCDPCIVFLGNLKLPTNIHGIKWFIKEVYPFIKSEIENIRFIVIGEKDEEVISRYSNNKISFLGFVTDLSIELMPGRLFIAPILIGAGIRTKILTAMSYGLPIVTTPVGIEGIEANESNGVFVSKSSLEFANNVKKLFRNRINIYNYGIEAKKYVDKYYSWESIISKLEKVYECLIMKKTIYK